jgi:sporulation protein YqfC
MDKRRRPWKRTVLRALDLPEEADGETVKVTMIGHDHLLVENHQGVLQFAADVVRLYSGDGVVRVEGDGLTLVEFSAGRAVVRGRIAGWWFEDGR